MSMGAGMSSSTSAQSGDNDPPVNPFPAPPQSAERGGKKDEEEEEVEKEETTQDIKEGDNYISFRHKTKE